MKNITPYFRQVHLDFHTSEHIDGIGADFDEDQFAEALELGHVNSINFFAMGHHGWCYYPTAAAATHPHLKTDLFGGMMRACKKAGVNPVVYITVIYISQPVFRCYADQGMQLHRDLVLNCIGLLYPERLLAASLPSGGRVSIARQSNEDRDIIHLLYAVPVKRGAVEVIEDIVPLHGVSVTYRTGREPSDVYLAPGREKVPYTFADGTVKLSVDTVQMHAMVVLEF